MDTPFYKDRLFRWAFALAVLSGAAFQGSRGLYESTEGRYAECARQTLETGNFAEPMLNGAHHWTKPPLAYTAIAGGLVTLGNNTWGARAYLVLCFVFTVIAVYALGRLVWGGAGGYSALVYATSPFTVFGANAISTDTPLVLFIALCMAFFWAAVRFQKSWYMLLMWAALGFAVLAKGPMGFFPIVGFAPIYFVLRKRGIAVPGVFNPLGWLLFAFFGLGWYFLSIARYPELFDYWVMHETVGRMVEGEFDRNARFYKIFVIYGPILAFGTGIWVFLLAFKARQLPWPRGRWLRCLSWEHGVEWTYLLITFFVPLFIYCASQSRLPLYVLPLFIPMSLMMGKGLQWLVDNGHFRAQTLLRVACAVALVLVLAKGISGHLHSRHDMKQLAAEIAPVLDKYPNATLKVIQKDPLNGLQFYLRRVIPMVRLDELPEGQDLNALLEDNTLLIFRAKYLAFCQGFIDQGFMRVEFEDEYWAVVAPCKNAPTSSS